MIERLKAYPKYRHSGGEWLGGLPEHWRAVAARALFEERNERGHPDEQMLSVTIRSGVIDQRTLLGGTSKKDSSNLDKSAYKLVVPGDLAYNKMRAWQGAIGLAHLRGIVSPAYVVVTPRAGSLPRYFHYLFRTPAFAKEAQRWSYGITSDQWSLRPEHFKMIYCSVPPVDEQRAIVRFLDHIDLRIRRYIAAKKKLIALLNEQRQVIVYRGVTRGLDSTVRLKSSGSDWLDCVPDHWTVASLRLRYDQCLGKMVDAKAATGQHPIPYLRNVDVHWDNINVEGLPTIDIAPHERDRFTVKAGDLLACEGRHLGRAAFWNGELAVCGFQKALHRLRVLDPTRDYPRFLYYCLYLANVMDAYPASSSDKSIPHLTGEMLRAHRFPFPPLAEQKVIAGYLDETFALIGRTINCLRAGMDQVAEYRTRLIADVVTGKLDVREAAAHLPDEIEDATDVPEPLDDPTDEDTEPAEEEEALL